MGWWWAWLVLSSCLLPLLGRGDQASPTWIWANPVPHGNNLVDLAYTNGLYLAVAERGRLYTSYDLDFWTARATQTTNALRGLGFFGSRILVTGEKGTILYADSLTNFHRVDLQTADWIEGVAVGPALAVAVGDNAAIYTSTNGAIWQRRPVGFSDWLRGVAYGAGLFVAVGENGRIAISTNGLTWQTPTSGTSAALNKVVWLTDRFWAVGEAGTTLVSAVGRNWTSVNTGATNELFTVVGQAEDRLVVGDNELRLGTRLWSGLPLTWHNELDPARSGAAPVWTYYCGVWDEEVMLVAGRTGFMIEGFRTNLLTASYEWSTRDTSARHWLWDITRWGSLYVAVGDYATILTSLDGASWDREGVPSGLTNRIFLGAGAGPAGIVVAGNSGALAFSPNQYTNLMVTNWVNGQPAVETNVISTLGLIWQAIAVPTTNDLQGVACDGRQWAVTGDSGLVLMSTNGLVWSPIQTPATAFLSSVAAYPGGWVAVGDLGTILTSPDGRVWQTRNSGTTNWIYRVRYLDGRLVGVGQNGSLLTSRDGINWTPQATGTSRWLYDAAYFDQAFWVVGNQGTVLTSPDLIAWQPVATLAAKALFGIATSPRQWVTVGVEGVILRAQSAPVQLQRFDRQNGTNIFVLSGPPGLVFTLDRSSDLQTWTAGETLTFLDQTGLLVCDRLETSLRQFYRPRWLWNPAP